MIRNLKFSVKVLQAFLTGKMDAIIIAQQTNELLKNEKNLAVKIAASSIRDNQTKKPNLSKKNGNSPKLTKRNSSYHRMG